MSLTDEYPVIDYDIGNPDALFELSPMRIKVRLEQPQKYSPASLAIPHRSACLPRRVRKALLWLRSKVKERGSLVTSIMRKVTQ